MSPQLCDAVKSGITLGQQIPGRGLQLVEPLALTSMLPATSAFSVPNDGLVAK